MAEIPSWSARRRRVHQAELISRFRSAAAAAIGARPVEEEDANARQGKARSSIIAPDMWVTRKAGVPLLKCVERLYPPFKFPAGIILFHMSPPGAQPPAQAG
jgi:hypothetical protein